MYLRFAAPIETGKPARVNRDTWVAGIKEKTQESLENAMAELLDIRVTDPYRELNPLAWRSATRPVA